MCSWRWGLLWLCCDLWFQNSSGSPHPDPGLLLQGFAPRVCCELCPPQNPRGMELSGVCGCCTLGVCFVLCWGLWGGFGGLADGFAVPAALGAAAIESSSPLGCAAGCSPGADGCVQPSRGRSAAVQSGSCSSPACRRGWESSSVSSSVQD